MTNTAPAGLPGVIKWLLACALFMAIIFPRPVLAQTSTPTPSTPTPTAVPTPTPYPTAYVLPTAVMDMNSFDIPALPPAVDLDALPTPVGNINEGLNEFWKWDNLTIMVSTMRTVPLFLPRLFGGSSWIFYFFLALAVLRLIQKTVERRMGDAEEKEL